MGDVKKAATSDSFGAALRELGVLHDDVFAFDADHCAEVSAFKKAFPDQYFSYGITGETAIAVAAGVAVRAAYKYQGSVYLRFSKLAVPAFHDEGTPFQIGRGEVLREGDDIAVLATGTMVCEALQAAEVLSSQGISIRVINLASIQPLDEELVLKAAWECGGIITCEEHSVTGGLGEAVYALLSEKHPTPVRRIGIREESEYSGRAQDTLKEFGLTAEHIAKAAKDIVMRK